MSHIICHMYTQAFMQGFKPKYDIDQGSKSRQKSCTIRTIFTTKVLSCTIFQLSQQFLVHFLQ